MILELFRMQLAFQQAMLTWLTDSSWGSITTDIVFSLMVIACISLLLWREGK